jgi:hypothetical protein
MKIFWLYVFLFLTFDLANTATASEKNSRAQMEIAWTSSKGSYTPSDGCVPDAKTAFKIAHAVLLPIYGEKEIEYSKPFVAILRKGVWTVGGMGYHPDIEGGGMEIDISKSDGRILRIYAGQ